MFIVFLIIILMQFHLSINSNTNDKDEVKPDGLFFDTNVTNIMDPHKSATTRTLFQVLISTEKRKSNLQSNIFDKMLSDEMLSIKQQIHEKDTIYPPTVHIKTKGSIPTPTLELKQMWPIEKLESNKEKKYNFEQHMKQIDNIPDESQSTQSPTQNIHELNKNDSKKEKVLELRSLSEKLHKKIKTSSLLHRITGKFCTCTKFNPQTNTDYPSDFARENGGKKLKIRDELYPGPEGHSKCSRTYSTNPPTYPFYITYSPYFVGTIADLSNIYYHPDAISDLKVPKHHKNRKHKKPTIEHIYEDDSEEEEDYYDKTTRRRADKTKNNYEFKFVYETTQESNPDIQIKDNIQIVNKDKFVEDIVDDLKAYYNEAVIKDCYCSSCSFKMGLQIMTFVYLIQWLVYNIIYF